MKVALVHDYIKEYGGAERVLEALHELYPDAPVFTTVYLPSFLGPHKQRFKTWDIRTSRAQSLPFKAKLISPLRLIAPFLFRQFDFSSFDVVIVSATGAYTPNMIQSKKQETISRKQPIHICYCHTPPRYLYGFATAREWKKNLLFRIAAEIANHILRMVDFKSAQHVDYFIANSKTVQARIKKFYRRDAVVIYPPVDIKNSKFEIRNSKLKNNTSYFLAGGRLARPKHIDIIVKACTELKVPLKVFGKPFAGYGEELEQIAGSTVEFLGEVSDEEKLELMQRAKAFIMAAEEEDFGITPVEAMGAGTPVIAYGSGGVVESIIDGKTGVLFYELSVPALKRALRQFEKLAIKPTDCREHAKKFAKERFKTEITHFIASITK